MSDNVYSSEEEKKIREAVFKETHDAAARVENINHYDIRGSRSILEEDNNQDEVTIRDKFMSDYARAENTYTGQAALKEYELLAKLDEGPSDGELKFYQSVKGWRRDKREELKNIREERRKFERDFGGISYTHVNEYANFYSYVTKPDKLSNVLDAYNKTRERIAQEENASIIYNNELVDFSKAYEDVDAENKAEFQRENRERLKDTYDMVKGLLEALNNMDRSDTPEAVDSRSLLIDEVMDKLKGNTLIDESWYGEKTKSLNVVVAMNADFTRLELEHILFNVLFNFVNSSVVTGATIDKNAMKMLFAKKNVSDRAYSDYVDDRANAIAEYVKKYEVHELDKTRAKDAKEGEELLKKEDEARLANKLEEIVDEAELARRKKEKDKIDFLISQDYLKAVGGKVTLNEAKVFGGWKIDNRFKPLAIERINKLFGSENLVLSNDNISKELMRMNNNLTANLDLVASVVKSKESDELTLKIKALQTKLEDKLLNSEYFKNKLFDEMDMKKGSVDIAEFFKQVSDSKEEFKVYSDRRDKIVSKLSLLGLDKEALSKYISLKRFELVTDDNITDEKRDELVDQDIIRVNFNRRVIKDVTETKFTRFVSKEMEDTINKYIGENILVSNALNVRLFTEHILDNIKLHGKDFDILKKENAFKQALKAKNIDAKYWNQIADKILGDIERNSKGSKVDKMTVYAPKIEEISKQIEEKKAFFESKLKNEKLTKTDWKKVYNFLETMLLTNNKEFEDALISLVKEKEVSLDAVSYDEYLEDKVSHEDNRFVKKESGLYLNKLLGEDLLGWDFIESNTDEKEREAIYEEVQRVFTGKNINSGIIYKKFPFLKEKKISGSDQIDKLEESEYRAVLDFVRENILNNLYSWHHYSGPNKLDVQRILVGKMLTYKFDTDPNNENSLEKEASKYVNQQMAMNAALKYRIHALYIDNELKRMPIDFNYLQVEKGASKKKFKPAERIKKFDLANEIWSNLRNLPGAEIEVHNLINYLIQAADKTTTKSEKAKLRLINDIYKNVRDKAVNLMKEEEEAKNLYKEYKNKKQSDKAANVKAKVEQARTGFIAMYGISYENMYVLHTYFEGIHNTKKIGRDHYFGEFMMMGYEKNVFGHDGHSEENFDSENYGKISEAEKAFLEGEDTSYTKVMLDRVGLINSRSKKVEEALTNIYKDKWQGKFIQKDISDHLDRLGEYVAGMEEVNVNKMKISEKDEAYCKYINNIKRFGFGTFDEFLDYYKDNIYNIAINPTKENTDATDKLKERIAIINEYEDGIFTPIADILVRNGVFFANMQSYDDIAFLDYLESIRKKSGNALMALKKNEKDALAKAINSQFVATYQKEIMTGMFNGKQLGERSWADEIDRFYENFFEAHVANRKSILERIKSNSTSTKEFFLTFSKKVDVIQDENISILQAKLRTIIARDPAKISILFDSESMNKAVNELDEVISTNQAILEKDGIYKFIIANKAEVDKKLPIVKKKHEEYEKNYEMYRVQVAKLSNELYKRGWRKDGNPRYFDRVVTGEISELNSKEENEILKLRQEMYEARMNRDNLKSSAENVQNEEAFKALRTQDIYNNMRANFFFEKVCTETPQEFKSKLENHVYEAEFSELYKNYSSNVNAERDYGAEAKRRGAIYIVENLKERGKDMATDLYNDEAEARKYTYKQKSPISARFGDSDADKVNDKKEDIEKVIKKNASLKEMRIDDTVIELLAELQTTGKKVKKDNLAAAILSLQKGYDEVKEVLGDKSKSEYDRLFLYTFLNVDFSKPLQKDQVKSMIEKSMISYDKRVERLNQYKARSSRFAKEIAGEAKEHIKIFEIAALTIKDDEAFDGMVAKRIFYYEAVTRMYNSMEVWFTVYNDEHPERPFTPLQRERIKKGAIDAALGRLVDYQKDGSILEADKLSYLEGIILQILDVKDSRDALADSKSFYGSVAFDEIAQDGEAYEKVAASLEVKEIVNSKQKSIWEKITFKSNPEIVTKYSKLTMEQRKLFELCLSLPVELTDEEKLFSVKLTRDDLVDKEEADKLLGAVKEFIATGEIHADINYSRVAGRLENADGKFNDKMFNIAYNFALAITVKQEQQREKDYAKLNDSHSNLKVIAKELGMSRQNNLINLENYKNYNKKDFVSYLRDMAKTDEKIGNGWMNKLENFKEGKKDILSNNPREMALAERVAKIAEGNGKEFLMLIAILQDRTVLDRSTNKNLADIVTIGTSSFVNEKKRATLKDTFIGGDEMGIINMLSEAVGEAEYKKAMETLFSYQLRDDVKINAITKDSFEEFGITRNQNIDWNLLQHALDFIEEVRHENNRIKMVRLAREKVMDSNNERAKEVYQKLGLDKDIALEEKNFDNVLDSQSKDAKGKNDIKETAPLIASFKALSHMEKVLFVKALQNRDILDVSRENLYASFFGECDRDFVNKKDRDELINGFILSSLGNDTTLKLTNEEYSNAMKSLLSSQIDDTREVKKEDNFIKLQSGEKWYEVFETKRETAIDWKLFGRALQLVKRTMAEREIILGDRELYRSRGEVAKNGQFQFDSEFLRKNLHNSGNRVSRSLGRKAVELTQELIPSISYLGQALNALLLTDVEKEKLARYNFNKPAEVEEEEEEDSLFMKIEGYAHMANGYANQVMANEENVKKGAKMFGVNIDKANFELGALITDGIDAFFTEFEGLHGIYEDLEANKVFNDMYVKAKDAYKQDRENAVEAEKKQTEREKEASRIADMNNTFLTGKMAYDLGNEKFLDDMVSKMTDLSNDLFGTNLVGRLFADDDAHANAANYFKLAVEGARDIILFARQALKEEEMLKTYYGTKNDNESSPFAKEINDLRNNTLDKKDKRYDVLQNMDNMNLARKAHGFESFTEQSSFVAMRMVHSIVFSASDQNPIMANRIKATAVFVLLGLENEIGKQDTATHEKVFNGLLNAKFR